MSIHRILLPRPVTTLKVRSSEFIWSTDLLNDVVKLIELGAALVELLSLLRLANLWDVAPLKAQVEKAIIDLKLVRLETWEASK